MSLRRSPRRTPAFLAANRANAQKSTGPRTAPGKQRSAANAFRTGNRTSPAFWPRGLSHREVAEFYALRDALDRALSAGTQGQKLVGLASMLVWSVRRSAERKLRTLGPETRRLMADRLIPVPHFWHRNIPRPGWKVTVTVLARRGRRRRCDMGSIPTTGPAPGAIRVPEARPARLHLITRVTCTGHPQFNRGLEGVALSLKPGAKQEKRTNPECQTKQDTYKNIAPNPNCQGVPEPSRAAEPLPRKSILSRLLRAWTRARLRGRFLRITGGRPEIASDRGAKSGGE
jgi:hypothetical protein